MTIARPIICSVREPEGLWPKTVCVYALQYAEIPYAIGPLTPCVACITQTVQGESITGKSYFLTHPLVCISKGGYTLVTLPRTVKR
jgi:hypothetical protein